MAEQEAKLITIACSTSRRPRSVVPSNACPRRWLNSSMSRRSVTDGSANTQKNELKPHLKKMWCIPPKQSAEFVYHMEDVLDVYKRPYDSKYPVICMDETFKQLIGETRQPLAVKPGFIERYDHVYTRNGVASLFLAFEPLRSWRTVWVTDHRQRLEWAQFISSLIRGRYRRAKKLVLVMDQLQHTLRGELLRGIPRQRSTVAIKQN